MDWKQWIIISSNLGTRHFVGGSERDDRRATWGEKVIITKRKVNRATKKKKKTEAQYQEVAKEGRGTHTRQQRGVRTGAQTLNKKTTQVTRPDLGGGCVGKGREGGWGCHKYEGGIKKNRPRRKERKKDYS